MSEKEEIAEMVSGFQKVEDIFYSPAIKQWIVSVGGVFTPETVVCLSRNPHFVRGEIRHYSNCGLTLYFTRPGHPEPDQPQK